MNELSKADLYALEHNRRRTHKTFQHLQPRRLDRRWFLTYAGRTYWNPDRQALLADIASIENDPLNTQADPLPRE